MSGLAPFFLTGANAKVKVNNRTFAFCTDLSYAVEVAHAAPTLLGNYEPASLEPLSYKVQGSFTVIRYVKGVSKFLKDLGYKVPNGIDDDGNGVGNWGPDNVFQRNGVFSSDGQAHKALNPSQLEGAIRFDIDIYQKLPNGSQAGVARIRDCRITRAQLTINKRNPAIQTFNFTALYVDEDTFVADMSGEGQQFG